MFNFILKNKRDPYFGRRVFQRGSYAWITKRMLELTWLSVILANLFTTIYEAFYVELFGIDRGSIFQQSDRVMTEILDYIKPSNWLNMLSPFKWQEDSLPWLIVFTIFLTLSLIISRSQWKNMKNEQQEEFGGAKWTEPFEVRQQYKAVPDRGETFEGYGGIPVAHQFSLNWEGIKLYLATVRDKYIPEKFLSYTAKESKSVYNHKPAGKFFIDEKAVNSLIIGQSRAGKGETLVKQIMDLVARGSKDQSLIVGDLKGELSPQAINQLRRHNYDVKVLNLSNLDYSMPIQLFDQAIYFAKKRNYSRARLKLGQLSNTIFPQDEGGDSKSKFFTNGSSATFTGLSLATLWLMRRENNWEKVTISNVTEMLQVMATQEEFVNSAGERFLKDPSKITAMDKGRNKNKLDLLVNTLKIIQKENIENQTSDELLDMAIASFNQSSMGGGETKGNIYSSMISDVDIFTSDIGVRRLTTISDFRYSSVGFPRIMELQLPEYFAKRKVKISFEANGKKYHDLVIADEMGLVQYAIEPKLDDQTTFKIDFDDPENKRDLEVLPIDTTISDKQITINAFKEYDTVGLNGRKKIDPDTKLPIIKGYKVKNIETDITNGQPTVDFDYSEKRIAVFVILPPLNQQYSLLAMFFLEQLYQENYEWAERNKKVTINRIHFLMDEFGNFPLWPRLETKLSSALGYNIEFSLVLQNMEQLHQIYGEDRAGTIRANSSNFAYIKTSSQKTADEVSTMLGNRTISYSNAGQDVADSDNRNRLLKEQPLLTAEQLMKFKPGQMVFFRSGKNNDKKGHLIETNPIYDYGWNAMPSAYNLLQGYFNNSPELSRMDIKSPQRYINLDDYRIDYLKLYDELYEETHPAYAEWIKGQRIRQAKIDELLEGED